MFFLTTSPKSPRDRSPKFKIAAFSCGICVLTAVFDIAVAAEVKFAIDNVLNDAILQTQNIMVSMSQGCSGGSNGVPPVNWGGLQNHGNLAVNALGAGRQALAVGQTMDAVRQIEFAGNELEQAPINLYRIRRP